MDGWELNISKADDCFWLSYGAAGECLPMPTVSQHVPSASAFESTKKQTVNYHGETGFQHKPSCTICIVLL